MKQLTDFFTLSNGYKIPCLGFGTRQPSDGDTARASVKAAVKAALKRLRFGTWQTPDGDTTIASVKAALQKGYRHIDTAAIYRNEASVGKGIAESGISRADIFVTSKVWNNERGYEKTLKAFEKTLADLRLDYLDLYLIHWPASSSRFPDWEDINLETWRAMMELYKEERIKAIGVSNFMPHHLEALLRTEVPPMVNQIEFHPGQMQDETVQFCKQNSILVEAWSPLGTGRMLSNPTLATVAGKYRKSVAQLCIRWCLQNYILPLPKSVTPSRIEENANVFDFVISDEDMATINGMSYFGGSGLHPDRVNF